MPDVKMVWNHRVHQQWADEDLSFWRLAFFPRFREPDVVATIERVLAEQEVSSYALYETLGLFDLFIRAWLPSQSHERVEQALNEALQGEFLQLLESFTVNRLLRHHVWDDGAGGLLVPDSQVLEKGLSDETIRAVNAGQLDPPTLASLKADKLIATLDADPGIKFFTIITSPVFSTTYGARRRLELDLLRVLDQSGLGEVSLYEGSGFGNFVVMGRARPDDFFAIPRLANEINDLGLYEAFIARPYTHVCGSETLLSFKEVIPPTKREEQVDARALLEGPESLTLEVKGSLHLDWRRFFHSATESRPPESEDVVNDGAVKAVVGMLNAEGGHVVLGALERRRVMSGEQLDPRFVALPQVGEYVVVGVDDEKLIRTQGWDVFRLHLLDLLASRIDPSPVGLINVTEAQLDGRTVAVIGVQPSATTWFYRLLGENDPVRFFAREDGRTKTYAGSDADNYKRARPRG
jgi:hypothetical protein